MRMNQWVATSKGGLVMRTGRSLFLARPFNKLGMSSIRRFSNETDARQYADGKEVRFS